GTFLGTNHVHWVSYVSVAVVQVALFVGGIDWIARFLNFSGPAVYVYMVLLLIGFWVLGGCVLSSVVGIMVEGVNMDGSAVAAVVVNFGDFARFTKSLRHMRRGNFYGLPVSLAFFTFLSLFITAGAYIVYQDGQGDPLTNPADIVGQVGNPALTVIAAITFFLATVGINLVANFIPPAYDLANLVPARISFRTGGYITAAIGFVIGALWVAVIGEMGLPKFVDTLGAILAPLYGILVTDYYILRKRRLDLQHMYSTSPDGIYWFTRGWNTRALQAGGLAATFSIAAVWVPALADLGGYAWLIGAVLGGLFHWIAMRNHVIV